ncbi:MAG: dihydroorotase [Kofleriaceae bacterium]
MEIVLVGGRVMSAPPVGAGDAPWIDAAHDVRIVDGVVAELGRGLRAGVGGREVALGGLWVVPGMVDLHVHLREPGQEYKEDLGSGTLAAARGGFTTVCAMPNTAPVNDTRAVTELIVRRAREIGHARVRPIGAVTRGLAGAALADIADMHEGGAVAISDDGRPVMNAGLLRRALEYARTFGIPLVQHAEDLDLAEGGAMNEGEVATRLGIRAQPACTESSMVARDLELVAWTGARYHVAHASAARTVALVRDAKRRGLPVTAEVTPHHLHLLDDACAHYDTNAKVMPPLRTAADRAALWEGLADGTLDAIATDHAPHSPVEKDVEFECAAPGMIGLETALPLTLELVAAGVIDVPRAIALLTSGPADTFGLAAGRLAPGLPADLAVIDPQRRYRLPADELASRSKNSPMLDRDLVGRAVITLLGGRVVHDLDGRFA